MQQKGVRPKLQYLDTFVLYPKSKHHNFEVPSRKQVLKVLVPELKKKDPAFEAKVDKAMDELMSRQRVQE